MEYSAQLTCYICTIVQIPTTSSPDAGVRPGPVDCVWSAFGEWGDCSVTCGPGGVERRRRKMLQQAKGGGRPCRAEDAVETRLCRRTPRQCAGSIDGVNLTYLSCPRAAFSTRHKTA